MDYVPALNKAREAFLETIEPICAEVDALDMALRHYEEVLRECGYVVVPIAPTTAMRDAAMGPGAQHISHRPTIATMFGRSGEP